MAHPDWFDVVIGNRQPAPSKEAIFKVLATSSVRTRDIGGNASTRDMGEAIADQVFATA